MSIKVNLNTIWVLSILLLVIIVLSGIKICDTPINTKITSNPFFVDKPYNYISEPFVNTPAPSISGTPKPSIAGTPLPSMVVTPTPIITGTPVPSMTGTPVPSMTGTPVPSMTGTPAPTVDFLSSISNLAKDKYQTTLAQTIELSKQNNQIGLLTRQIDAIENKIKVLQQY